MKHTYTESGRRAMDQFLQTKEKELEDVIVSRKYVFGDDLVEITASDVKEATERQGRPYSSLRSTFTMQAIFQLYIVIGGLTLMGGLFYPNLKDILDKNPIQLVLILCGAGLSLVSFVMLQRIRKRQSEVITIQRLEKEKASRP